jgi:threonine dehydratase
VLELDDVRAAAGRLAGVVHRTPVLTSRELDHRAGATVMLKAEHLQRAGAFKIRGAYNTIASMTPDERAGGVVAASSGNHAQAVALAASLHDIPATILVPADASELKVTATVGYGAEVLTYDRYAADREALLADLAASAGRPVVHPYDDPRVMAGQGTVALELVDQIPGLDVIVCPVGGGGLIAGCATVAAAQADPIRVIGVEPETGDDVRRSLAAGERVTIEVPRTIADGQQLTTPGVCPFEVIRERVDQIVTVTDAQIVDAMRFAFERMKIVLEPSGATGLAAVLAGLVDAAGARIGVVLSGGNVSAVRFAELISGAPRTQGRAAPVARST